MKSNAPFFHGLYGHGYVAVACDEDDGQGGFAFDEAVLQLQASHAAHADINKQAGNFAGVEVFEKALGRVKGAHVPAFAFKQPLQGVAHGFIVINNVDGAFIVYQAHGDFFW